MIIFTIVTIIILFGAMTTHEYAHAWMANKLGDSTAKDLGRLTLNPIKHIDITGTILLPAILIFIRSPFLFGWAKPVPVNFMRLRNPKQSMMWVAIAGPIINLVQAVIFSILMRFVQEPFFYEVLKYGVLINLLFAVFNMIPIPPLDGSRVVMGLLPDNLANAYARLERYGMLIIVGLLMLGVYERIVFPLLELGFQILGVPLYS